MPNTKKKIWFFCLQLLQVSTLTENDPTGVLQGDTLAPILFVIGLDYVLRQSMNSEHGLVTKPRQSRRHPAKTITVLDFADDLALLSNTVSNAQLLLNNLEHAAAQVGLRINHRKTHNMCVGAASTPGDKLQVAQGELDQVEDFCYVLGEDKFARPKI
jgi:hypothetical protein